MTFDSYTCMYFLSRDREFHNCIITLSEWCTFPKSEMGNAHREIERRNALFDSQCFEKKLCNLNSLICIMPRVSVILCLLIIYAAYLVICDHCCVINYQELPRYNLIKNNRRSNQPIISRKVVLNVEKCEEFAASKRALAFNLVSARNRAGRRITSTSCHKYNYDNFTKPGS